MSAYHHIDTERAWHVRMAQARRYMAHALTRRSPPHADALLAAAAKSVPPGWRLAVQTRADLLADYRRVIRRNNPRTLARLIAAERGVA